MHTSADERGLALLFSGQSSSDSHGTEISVPLGEDAGELIYTAA